MQILRVNIELQVLIAESQTTEAENDGLLHRRWPAGHQVMTSLLLQSQQPSVNYFIDVFDCGGILPESWCISARDKIIVIEPIINYKFLLLSQ